MKYFTPFWLVSFFICIAWGAICVFLDAPWWAAFLGGVVIMTGWWLAEDAAEHDRNE